MTENSSFSHTVECSDLDYCNHCVPKMCEAASEDVSVVSSRTHFKDLRNNSKPSGLPSSRLRLTLRGPDMISELFPDEVSTWKK